MRNNNNDKSYVNFPRNFRYDWVKKNGKPTGIAQVYTSNNKCIYQGPIKNRKPHGKEGKAFGVDGGLCCDGNWKDGKMDGMVKVYNQDGLIRTKEIWKEGNFQRLSSFWDAPCRSGVFINADQRYELSKKDKKTFMNRKREREVRDGDLEIDNSSSQSSLKDTNKHDKKKGF